MTEGNLEAAFAGESQAQTKYLIFAERAEKEGFPNVARLFRATSYAEQVHATSHFRTLGNIGQTLANLEAAIGGETFEVEEMYPAYKAVADVQDEKAAHRSNAWAMEAEKVHAGLYELARQNVLSGKDADVGDVHICRVCGWTVEGESPDRCPLCGAKSDQFTKF